MLSDLRSIVQQVSEAADLEVALEIIVSRVNRSMSVSVCSVYLFDEQNQRYLLMGTKGLSQKAVRKASLGIGEGLVGLVASREEPINLEIADKHPPSNFCPRPVRRSSTPFWVFPSSITVEYSAYWLFSNG